MNTTFNILSKKILWVEIPNILLKLPLKDPLSDKNIWATCESIYNYQYMNRKYMGDVWIDLQLSIYTFPNFAMEWQGRHAFESLLELRIFYEPIFEDLIRIVISHPRPYLKWTKKKRLDSIFKRVWQLMQLVENNVNWPDMI